MNNPAAPVAEPKRDAHLGRIWGAGVSQPCIFCLGPYPSMVYKIDKRGGAFLHCNSCGTRAFLKGPGHKGPEKLFGAMTLAIKDNNMDAAFEMIRRGVESTKQELGV